MAGELDTLLHSIQHTLGRLRVALALQGLGLKDVSSKRREAEAQAERGEGTEGIEEPKDKPVFVVIVVLDVDDDVDGDDALPP